MKSEIKRFIANIAIDLAFAVVAAFFASYICQNIVPIILGITPEVLEAQKILEEAGKGGLQTLSGITGVVSGAAWSIYNMFQRFDFKLCFVLLYGLKFVVNYVSCLFNVREVKNV